MPVDMARHRRGETGDAALHVDGAAAIHLAVGDLPPKRADASMPPRRRPAPRRCVRQTSDAGRCRSGAHRGSRCPACRLRENTGRSTEKPSGFSIASSTLSAPPSAGVTEGQRIRAARFSAGSIGSLMAARDSRKRQPCHAAPTICSRRNRLQRRLSCVPVDGCACGVRTWAVGGPMLDRNDRDCRSRRRQHRLLCRRLPGAGRPCGHAACPAAHRRRRPAEAGSRSPTSTAASAAWRRRRSRRLPIRPRPLPAQASCW